MVPVLDPLLPLTPVGAEPPTAVAIANGWSELVFRAKVYDLPRMRVMVGLAFRVLIIYAYWLPGVVTVKSAVAHALRLNTNRKAPQARP